MRPGTDLFRRSKTYPDSFVVGCECCLVIVLESKHLYLRKSWKSSKSGKSGKSSPTFSTFQTVLSPLLQLHRRRRRSHSGRSHLPGSVPHRGTGFEARV